MHYKYLGENWARMWQHKRVILHYQELTTFMRSCTR